MSLPETLIEVSFPGGRRLVTLSAEPFHFRTLCKYLDRLTWRRRAVARYAVVDAHCKTWLPKQKFVPTAELSELALPIDGVARDRAPDIPAIAVFWPGRDRSHRRSLTGMEDPGMFRVLSKVSADPRQNATYFETECDTLRQFNSTPSTVWRTLRGSELKSAPAGTACTVEAPPGHGRTVERGQILGNLPLGVQGYHSSVDEKVGCGSLPWMSLSSDDVEPLPTLRQQVRAVAREPISARLGSEDIRLGNALMVNGDSWLLDCEFSLWIAPDGLDIVVGIINQLTFSPNTQWT